MEVGLPLLSVFRAAQRLNHSGQLHDLNVLGAVVPIVPPANNHIATTWRMAMVPEIPALKFKLDIHALPPLRANLPFGLAVRESLLDCFNHVAEFLGKHPKQHHYALLVDGLMPHTAKVHGIAIRGAVS